MEQELVVGKRVRINMVAIASYSQASARARLLGQEGIVTEHRPYHRYFNWKVTLDSGKTYIFAALELEVIEETSEAAATKYYVITSGEGDSASITEETGASLLRRLNAGEFGYDEDTWRTRLPTGIPRCCDGLDLIIKGEIVTPRIKATIFEI